MTDIRAINDGPQPRQMPVSIGLFVLRYASSTAGANPPVVTVSAEADNRIEVVTPSGAKIGIMSAPGEALVIRAMQKGNLVVRMAASLPGGSNHAHLVLERISASAPPARSTMASTSNVLDITPRNPLDISILAHVARRGDVIEKQGEWICGPNLPMAIEGLEVRWPGKPAGLDILISGWHLAGGRKRALDKVPSGAFLGSRGKASPFTALSVAIAGPSASAFMLKCEALFLGTQVLRKSGLSIDLSGPTGLEPLVGLRLSLVPAGAAQLAPATMAQSATALSQPSFLNPVIQSAGSSGRVRVFRTSRSRQTLTPSQHL